MTKCPHCYRSIPDAVLKCPYCHGNVVTNHMTTVGQPAKRRQGGGSMGLILSVAAFGFLALGGVGAAVILLPKMMQQTAPLAALPAPTITPGGPTLTPAPPTATATAAPTRKAPEGWVQMGGDRERYAVWVPANWTVYEADLDQADNWMAVIGELDATAGELVAREDFAAMLRAPGTRAVAINVSKDALFYSALDIAAVIQKDELIGQSAKDVLAAMVEGAQNAYGARALQISLQKEIQLKGQPAAKLEYTYNEQLGLGKTVAVHGTRIVVIGADSAFELIMQSAEARYSTAYSQAYQQFSSSFRFNSLVEETALELPSGWHEVRSEGNGYAIWVPNDWFTFNRDSDDYASWSAKVSSSYTLGSKYLELYNYLGSDKAAFLAVEPIANKNASIWLGTAMVELKPVEANDSPRKIVENLRAGDLQNNAKIRRSAVVWQFGRPTAFHESVGWINLPNFDQVNLDFYTVSFVDGDRQAVLTILALEDQPKQFKSTLDLIARSFHSAR